MRELAHHQVAHRLLDGPPARTAHHLVELRPVETLQVRQAALVRAVERGPRLGVRRPGRRVAVRDADCGEPGVRLQAPRVHVPVLVVLCGDMRDEPPARAQARERTGLSGDGGGVGDTCELLARVQQQANHQRPTAGRLNRLAARPR